MKSAPRVSQDAGPGTRLMTGRLLNQIIDAVQARTALNATRSTAQGYDAAAPSGSGAAPQRMQAPMRARFQPGRSYVVQPAFFQRLAADLAARKPSGGRAGASPGPAATAAGLRDLMDLIRRLSPDAVAETLPQGFRLPSTERAAALRIEIQRKLLNADMCALAVHLDTQQYETVQTSGNVFENGTSTLTVTASGVIRTWGASAVPTECATPVYDNDFDPDFDYGAFISSSYDVTYAPFSAVWEAAVAGLAGATAEASELSFAWAEDQWRAVSAGAWSAGVGSVGVGVFEEIPALSASTVRWRAINEGQCTLGLLWEHRNPAGTLLDSNKITLPRGRTSDWQEPPAASADPDQLRSVTLSGIEIGPYR